MAFDKNNFQDGDILYAAHVNRIEDVLAELVDAEEKNNVGVQSDWDNNNTDSINHISGRPLWLTNDKLRWDGISGDFVDNLGYLILKENLCSAAQLINSEISFDFQGNTYTSTISAYIRDNSIYNKILDESEHEYVVVLADQGNMTGTMIPGNWVELQALFIESGEVVILGYYYSNLYFSLKNISNHEGGLYVIPYEWANTVPVSDPVSEQEAILEGTLLPALYGTVKTLNYSAVAIDERYYNFFYGSQSETNLHLVTAAKLADVQFDQFTNGDVIIVYISNTTEVFG